MASIEKLKKRKRDIEKEIINLTHELEDVKKELKKAYAEATKIKEDEEEYNYYSKNGPKQDILRIAKYLEK